MNNRTPVDEYKLQTNYRRSTPRRLMRLAWILCQTWTIFVGLFFFTNSAKITNPVQQEALASSCLFLVVAAYILVACGERRTTP